MLISRANIALNAVICMIYFIFTLARAYLTVRASNSVSKRYIYYEGLSQKKKTLELHYLMIQFWIKLVIGLSR